MSPNLVKSQRNPLASVVLAWVAYIMSFPIGHASPVGDMFAAVALIPAVMTAHLFGRLGALWVVGGFIPLQISLYMTSNHQFGWDMVAGVEGLFALGAVPLVALYVGSTAELRQRLEQTNLERDRFIAAVAHDIKNPLTGVIGLALALVDDPSLQDEPRELAALIAAEAQAATDVIEDLSVTALRNSGKFTVHPESFDILEEVTPMAQRISAAVSAGSDRVVWADRRRVRQILQNLVANAERHGAAPYEFEIITVGTHVVLKLRDQGPGIPETMVDRLFEPFAMVGVSDHLDSTGLGLSSARVLATLMSGDLLYRRDDATTEFQLKLPVPRVLMTTSEAMIENPSL